MKTKTNKIIVEGSGNFPLDMLRYDRACPYMPEDVSKINERGQRQITLLSFYAVTAKRWESFCWKVISIAPYIN